MVRSDFLEIMTRDFGKIEINEEKIIVFQKGLPGFETIKKFVLLPFPGDAPFVIFQAIKKRAVAFTAVDPADFFANYQFEINEQTEKELKINSRKDLMILNIINIKDEVKESTVNLAAPLVINLREKLAKQVILDDNTYQLRCKLFNREQMQNEVAE